MDLRLEAGAIHALLGENGAGKSTLIKILTGIQRAEAGHFRANGLPVEIGSPASAARHGIVLVPQDILVVPKLSIGRNILLGFEGGLSQRGRLSVDERTKIEAALAIVGAAFDPETPASRLGVPHLRLAQIARALIRKSDVLVLDEPTAVLSEPDANHLLERLEHLRDSGNSILYVTHRLSEVMRLADRITVLRDGRVVGTYERGEVDRAEIMRVMAKDVPRPAAAHAIPAAAVMSDAAPRLRVENLSSSFRFADVSLVVRPGTIVGIAGVQGSGHGQLIRAIAGVDKADTGRIVLDDVELAHGAVANAVSRGMMIVPADRRGAAIVAKRSLRENLALSGRIRHAARRFGLRWPGRERAMMAGHMRTFDIRAVSSETRIGTLSGGNQQKVALARVFESNARALLVEEPTQGIDVRAKAEIHALLRKLARERDCAVLIATSEFEELIGLADEIHVMRSGRIVATMTGAEANYHKILENALP
ncbi:sugar ABC transporter ATP-binding protein [Beijerinckia sp. L45]|uniref:sugar ABC transporter ATP-binding protein n=1 Tax=Beijerinckia sp. L45 TaxID=1641855 RepID=UPI00131C3B6E|nr:sugar ABC transporter ATP-binding protein [Beijerinckia sp. L45]